MSEDRALLPPPEVLARLLHQAGAIPPGTIVAISAVEHASATGQLGQIQRVRLAYRPNNASGPSSVVVKATRVETQDADAFAVAEERFYAHHVADRCELRVPKFFGAVTLPDGTRRLILEDLGHAGIVRQIDGCTPEQASAALREIAALHAAWWEEPLPPALSWIRSVGESPVGRFCRRWIGAYTGSWPAVLGSAPRLLQERFDQVAAQVAGSPSTVVHGDYHSQNIVFGTATEPPTIFDFQFVHRASCMVDVARFLATSLTIDVRRAHEFALLDCYQQALRTHGIVEFDLDGNLDAFRAALIWNMATPLTLHLVRMATRGEEWAERFPILERCVAAIEDWDALRLF